MNLKVTKAEADFLLTLVNFSFEVKVKERRKLLRHSGIVILRSADIDRLGRKLWNTGARA